MGATVRRLDEAAPVRLIQGVVQEVKISVSASQAYADGHPVAAPRAAANAK
jgi:hypothetical protein